jgi:hypothetical protein
LLIYEGDTIPVYQLILEEYLHSIKEPDQGELFGLSFRDNASFNCWRGYQAIYIIENDSLFLKNITSCGELYYKGTIDINASSERIEEIFRDKAVAGKVFVSWYSGDIAIPRGDLLRWDGVFSRTYYNEEILEFEKGLLTDKKIVNNYIKVPSGIPRGIPKGKLYPDYKMLTDTIFALIKQLDWNKLSDCDCDGDYFIEINEKGKIGEIEPIFFTDDKEKIKRYKKEATICIKQFKKKLKNLQFDIVKWNGKPYQEQLRFEIFYTVDGELENWNSYSE